MFNFLKKFLKNNNINKEKVIYKEDIKIKVTGNNSKAFGVWDYAIPTGICSNPETNAIKKIVNKDKLGKLLNNPITYCIFCNKTHMLCFYGGYCKQKQPIDNDILYNYCKAAEAEIEAKYGKKPLN